jgi:hypothetical protein
MQYDTDSMSEKKVRSELNKYVRLFEVAYETLLFIKSPRFAGDPRELAEKAHALIQRYPYDDRYMCGGNKLREEMEAEAAKASPAEVP